jgi:hypothetical protein
MSKQSGEHMAVFQQIKRLIRGAVDVPDKSTGVIIRLRPKPIIAIGKTNECQTTRRSQNADLITGFQFIATMQVRTPLRVLLRHGEVHRDINRPLPRIVHEGWEGIWIIKTEASQELSRAYVPGCLSANMSAKIGEIPADGKYLEFLIAVRTIVEACGSIDSRIGQLLDMLAHKNSRHFANRLGGIDVIIEEFFPQFVDTVPKLPADAADMLCRLGFNTPNRLAAASDEILLAITGLERAKLKMIREHCTKRTFNRDADRVENVKW